MKNLANYISISRILMSIVLIFTKPFSLLFYIIYLYCGISDMLDGCIARKSKNTTRFGSLLDSIADIIFVMIAIIKIVPFLNFSNEILIWIMMIALVKISNVICAYIYCKKFIFPHTIANKMTGFILFMVPFILLKNRDLILEAMICCIATFAAIQEGYFIRTKRCN